MADYTTTALVAAIKRRGSFPTSQQLFTVDELISFSNDELQSILIPLIMSTMEDYFLDYEDVALNANTNVYDIPGQAVGLKLRSVAAVVSQGGAQETIYAMPRLTLEQLSQGGSVNGFYVEGNTIRLYPQTTQTGTLRLYYIRRLLDLCNVTSAGQITVINTGTSTVTTSNQPAGWGTGTLLSIVSAESPFKTLAESTGIVSGTGPYVLAPDVVSLLSVGDWLCPAGSSTIPQIPVEAMSILAQLAVSKCMEALGDEKGFGISEKKLEQLRNALMIVLTPRVDSSPKKVYSNSSLARWSKNWFWGGNWR